MSDELPSSMPELGRPLRSEEAALIRFLLTKIYSVEALDRMLTGLRATDMHDGGMGSIRFLAPGSRSFGMALIAAQYLDTDGVLVSIAINADKQGKLFELDFWKVDFSSLKRYPNPSDLSGIEPPLHFSPPPESLKI